MKKNGLMMVIVCILFITLGSGNVRAGEVDILIKKLVEKRILTRTEASQLMDEMQKEMSRQKEEMKQVAKEAAKEEAKGGAVKLPSWVENTKFKGDFRLRYQKEDTENDGNVARKRSRIRLRAGVESKVSDQWKAGFGLATGGTDPRSTNQTLDNTFETPDIRLDYAYAQYKLNKMFDVSGGKIKNPFWGTKDLLWDGDIRPDGIAAGIESEISPDLEFFATPVYFILEEFANTSKDPAMMAIQPGINWKINKSVSLKLAGTYYNFIDVKGSDMSIHSAGTNSRDNANKWVYDYDSIAADAELGVKVSGMVPYFGLFGQYVVSNADDSQDMDGYKDNKGWLAGFKVGHKSVKDLGHWQFKYNYRKLEKDAWPDWLPDSDFYGGATGVKGSEFELALGVYKNVTFGVDYYMTEPIRLAPGALSMDQDLLQLDLVVKF